jgi:nucleotide-binding universal stress UspA family protein
MSKKPAIKHILLAYDASQEADQAFEAARAFAQRFDADLEVVSVVHPPKYAEMMETRAALEEGEQRVKQGHRRLRHITQGEHFAVHFQTKFGRPTEQILATAEEVSADLIVMGHRHRSALERGFNRSTALKVLGSAHCPVLIVPEG